MKLKRLLCTVLTVAMLCGMLVLPGTFAASDGYFTDISDTVTAEAAEMLRMMGIVEGVGGTRFNPSATLTRAEFCKMALLAARRGDEAKTQATRVIFLDVPSTHWALGYINAAATAPTDGTALVQGKGTGNFEPSATITMGEAVTMLMRILGYSDSDFVSSGAWWSGHMAAANSLNLTSNIAKNGDDVINRAEAARLFSNLMITYSKGTSTRYVEAFADAMVSDALILDVNATAEDGSGGALRTQTATYKMANVSSAARMYAGQRADLALDSSGRVLCILPARSGEQRTFAIGEAKYTGIETTDGDFIRINGSIVIYTGDGSTTYEAEWLNLASGTVVTAYYGTDGKLASLYIPDDADAQTMVIGLTGSIADLTGGETSYSVFKNGAPVSGSAARTYDVATYNAAARAVNLSDLRLTGVYMDVYPNPDTPARITMLGIDFELLPDAIDMMAKFTLGDTVTLLLTPSTKTVANGTTTVTPGKVAGVVDPSVVSSNAIGVAVFDMSTFQNGTDGSQPRNPATITLLDGLEVSGQHTMSRLRTQNMNGSLVSVTSSRDGILTMSTLPSNRLAGSLDVANRTLGDVNLSSGVRIFERAGTGEPVAISLEDIKLDTVAASKILYASLNDAEQVNYLILDDVTGDRYQYGIIRYQANGTSTDANGDRVTVVGHYKVEFGTGQETVNLLPINPLKDGIYGGIAVSIEMAQNGSDYKAAASTTLTEAATANRADFTPGDPVETEVTVTVNGVTYPVSEGVVCYNATTKRWFDSLESARAYSNNLVLYIDRPVSEGGKVRMIVIE